MSKKLVARCSLLGFIAGVDGCPLPHISGGEESPDSAGQGAS